MSGVHGSADITAELNLQPRLVIAPQACIEGDNIDACAYLSLPKTEQDSGLSSELQDHAVLHANHSIPTPSDSDDGRVATEDEVRDLLHVVDRVPVRLWVACLAGILERFVWYGATAPIRAWLPPHLQRCSTDCTYRELPAKCTWWCGSGSTGLASGYCI